MLRILTVAAFAALAGASDAQAPEPRSLAKAGDFMENNIQLFVGNLDHKVTEIELSQIFKNKAASIKVHRQSGSSGSLSSAIVSYNSVLDAECAFDELNYVLIRKKPLEIFWLGGSGGGKSVAASSVAGSSAPGSSYISVKNLPNDRELGETRSLLYETFAKIGTIKKCSVAPDAEGRSKGFGFVHFADAEAAAEAIKLLDRTEIGGKSVRVRPLCTGDDAMINPMMRRWWQVGREWQAVAKLSKADYMRYHMGQILATLYVGNLNEKVTATELSLIFKQRRGVALIQLHRDSRGARYATVGYNTVLDAERDVDELNLSMLGDRPLNILWWKRRADSLAAGSSAAGSSYIYLDNLANNLELGEQSSRVCKMFAKFGSIRKCKLASVAKGRSLRVGFVHFENAKAAGEAIHFLDNTEIFGKQIHVRPLCTAESDFTRGEHIMMRKEQVGHEWQDVAWLRKAEEERKKALFEEGTEKKHVGGPDGRRLFIV